jgi:hypothetical protein
MQHIQNPVHVEIWDGLPSGQIDAWRLALLEAAAGTACRPKDKQDQAT